jgi:pimeloyl-ACP methyl ester carboxylesterase
MIAVLLSLLPVVLIHGYAEDSHVWDSWASWLKSDHFNVTSITFRNDDRCGSVKQHAMELNNTLIHSGRVNIIAHSAGGLVARWYIAHNPDADKVANLVMIATPNTGTTAAYLDLTTCAGAAGVEDLKPGSEVTQTTDQANTHYYTITGNYAIPCYFVILRYTCYIDQNDGLVTVSSAQSVYPSLGVFPYNHTGLLRHRDVYEKALPILRQ